MFVKQLIIFVENKSGKVADILEVLGQNHIDISALSIADTAEYGLMRMIVSDPEKARKALSETGVVVKISQAVAVPIDNQPGGLSSVMSLLKNAGISVEYLYAFVGRKDGGAVVVMKTDKQEETVSILEQNGISTLSENGRL